MNFIRIEGLNAKGEEQSIYGDFVYGASVQELADIVWSKSDSIDGEYVAIEGASGTSYTPSDGGFYLKVSAKYGVKTLKSYPVYIRNDITKLSVTPYLSYEQGKLSASFAYTNEGDEADGIVLAAIYDGTQLLSAYYDGVSFKNGSDINISEFETTEDMTGKTAKMFVWESMDSLTPVCESVSLSSTLPTVEFNDASSSSVLLDGEEIAVFKDNRYMQIRSSTKNDHWIGTAHSPSDMGFAYQEPNVKGFTFTSTDFAAAPGLFKVKFDGEKPGLDTVQTVEIIGYWDESKEAFTYIRNASLTAKTETWHGNSNWAAQANIEVFDYCLERMSILDRVYNDNLNGDLYDYIMYADNKSDITRIPKLPVPRTALSGTYFYDFYLSPGGSIYIPDAKEGGWEATLLSDSGDTRIEICWSWYDIHNCIERTIPQVGTDEYFTAHQSWRYTPTDADYDSSLIDSATEVDYKNISNYRLPTFGTTNTFDTQFGGTDWCYAWWKSSYDCDMDSSVGKSDSASVVIEHSTSKESSWYTEGVWGYPYSFDNVKGIPTFCPAGLKQRMLRARRTLQTSSISTRRLPHIL